jgi:hypothetical protein
LIFNQDESLRFTGDQHSVRVRGAGQVVVEGCGCYLLYQGRKRQGSSQTLGRSGEHKVQLKKVRSIYTVDCRELEPPQLVTGGPEELRTEELKGEVIEAEKDLDCTEEFSLVNISMRRFSKVVAHGIHSISLQDLRRYFNPNAMEENHIPVVDLNLTSSTPVLPHSPALPPSPFTSLGFRIADQVLSHMDDPMYGLKNFNGLERLVHELHMHEIWERARPYYTILSYSPAPAPLCECAIDLQHNGVMESLRTTALKLREPEMFYRQPKTGTNTTAEGGEKYHVHYHFHLQDEDEGEGGLEEGMQPLVDQEAWEAWKGGKSMEKDDYSLALFMHCMLD